MFKIATSTQRGAPSPCRTRRQRPDKEGDHLDPLQKESLPAAETQKPAEHGCGRLVVGNVAKNRAQKLATLAMLLGRAYKIAVMSRRAPPGRPSPAS